METETETANTTANAEHSTNGDNRNEPVNCVAINTADEWVHLEAEVVSLWEPTSEKIAQVGLLADGTGTVKFTSWAKSELPEVEEGQSYRFENVVSSEYEGQYSVNLNNATDIEQLEGEDAINTNNNPPIERSGALVAIQNGSGLIKRCPEENCSFVLRNGRCPEHSQVDGEFDLRIKAALDDGTSVQSVVLNAETTTAITDTTIDEAKQMAKDALDTSVVADQFRSQLLGRYYNVKGPVIGEYHFVNRIAKQSADSDS